MSSVLTRLNPQLASLPVYVPGKPIEHVAREHGLDPGSIIKLASNENPLGASPKALAAVRGLVDTLHLYPDGSAFNLKAALAETHSVAPNQLILGNGSNEVLELIAHAFLGPGDEVVVSQYCFAVYPIVTALMGASLISVPALPGLQADIPGMIRAITPRTKVLFLANPNNPTGTLTSRADVAQLLAEVPSHVLLVLDEAYIEFLNDPIDLLPLVRVGSHPNLLLARTFSKIHGLAGLRLGYGMGSAGVVAALEKAREPFNLNTLAQAAGIAALHDTEHQEKTRANNRRGLEFYSRQLFSLGLEVIPSSGNFVLVKVGDGARIFAELQKRGVITRPVTGYQLPEWLRISVGTPDENERCVRTLRDVLGK
jgi:histidinol-phosphate aminotransferase